MSTMELTHDAAQAELTRLLEQQREWTRKREQLGTDLALLQAHAGEQARASTSTPAQTSGLISISTTTICGSSARGAVVRTAQ